MKKHFLCAPLLLSLLLLLSGCAKAPEPVDVAATTLPVYEFTRELCRGTGLSVGRLVTESVSCLHDYSLNVNQVRLAEQAEVLVLSGAGLEDFMEDLLTGKPSIDASQGIALLEGEEHDHEEHGEPDEHEGHHHEVDPHIWLSPENAKIMVQNICQGLSRQYPQWEPIFTDNLQGLLSRLDDLEQYGQETLKTLSCRGLLTFHDGFAYFAQAFDLDILAALEEESGSEASAKELIGLIRLARAHALPAVFVEKNGSASAADILCRETGAKKATLDMAMAGDSYFDAMYHNIDTIKEALG